MGFTLRSKTLSHICWERLREATFKVYNSVKSHLVPKALCPRVVCVLCTCEWPPAWHHVVKRESIFPLYVEDGVHTMIHCERVALEIYLSGNGNYKNNCTLTCLNLGQDQCLEHNRDVWSMDWLIELLGNTIMQCALSQCKDNSVILLLLVWETLRAELGNTKAFWKDAVIQCRD